MSLARSTISFLLPLDFSSSTPMSSISMTCAGTSLLGLFMFLLSYCRFGLLPDDLRAPHPVAAALAALVVPLGVERQAGRGRDGLAAGVLVLGEVDLVVELAIGAAARVAGDDARARLGRGPEPC